MSSSSRVQILTTRQPRSMPNGSLRAVCAQRILYVAIPFDGFPGGTAIWRTSCARGNWAWCRSSPAIWSSFPAFMAHFIRSVWRRCLLQTGTSVILYHTPTLVLTGHEYACDAFFLASENPACDKAQAKAHVRCFLDICKSLTACTADSGLA